MRAVPKLNNAHIFPNKFHKLSMKLAKQVLNATVSASLNLYIRFVILPAAAAATSEVVTRSDNLFSLMNSSTTKHSKKYKRAHKGLNYQEDYFRNMMYFSGNRRLSITIMLIQRKKSNSYRAGESQLQASDYYGPL